MVENNEELRDYIGDVYRDMKGVLYENQKRLLGASLSKHLKHGGITLVSEETGLARSTILTGIKELDSRGEESNNGSQSDKKNDGKYRIRKPGGGRKKLVDLHPELPEYIENIVKDSTFGTPEDVIFWTDLSLRDIAEKVTTERKIPISYNVVSHILDDLGYSKQLNQKMYQVGEISPDRDAQFRYINEKAASFQKAGEPVISVDTKKKELLGNFKNNGQEYRPKYNPRNVLDHDFPLKELGKIAPYGVYLLNNNTGFVNIGQDHDTAEFAGESINQWWNIVGKNTFPNATKLYITCDCGGSNGCHTWLWKSQLQELANITNLEIHVSHYPPGTSKWNKIEHRLFCYISKNWQGKPLIDIETVVKYIGSTTTKKGLKVICRVDNNRYELGKKITQEEKNSINIEFTGPNENWNYIIRPNVGVIS